MKKRNLILMALVITTLMVFTQIGAMAGTLSGTCVIVWNSQCQENCPDQYQSVTCHANNCDEQYSCCDYLQNRGTCFRIRDNTPCANPCCM